MKRTALSRLLQEACWLSEAAHDAHVERLEDARVTALDRRLLERLESARGALSPHRLARPLLCPASDVESRLRALQERAWVRQVASKGSGPAAFELDEAGRRALVRLRQRLREFEDASGGALDDEELRVASSLLRAIRLRLHGERQRRGRARRRGVAESADFERPRRGPGVSVDVAGAVSA